MGDGSGDGGGDGGGGESDGGGGEDGEGGVGEGGGVGGGGGEGGGGGGEGGGCGGGEGDGGGTRTFTVLRESCTLHTFTILRQNALTFTLPPPYDMSLETIPKTRFFPQPSRLRIDSLPGNDSLESPGTKTAACRTVSHSK